MSEGFNIRRYLGGRSDRDTGGQDWVLHVSSVGIPTVGRQTGKNWILHIDANKTPTIRGRT
jgi:hypothetical protein